MKKRSVGMHINNGGVTIGVDYEEEAGGPTITVSAMHFGHVTNGMRIFVGHEELSDLVEMFAAAAEEARSVATVYGCRAKGPTYDALDPPGDDGQDDGPVKVKG